MVNKLVGPKDNKQKSGCYQSATSCGESTRVKTNKFSFEAVIPLLVEQGAIASSAEMERFVEVLSESIRHRESVSRRWARIKERHDIISLIYESIESEEWNEAVWRSFLAAHFGRASAKGPEQTKSAVRFLCAFGEKPFWTWNRVSEAPEALEEWLTEHSDELTMLAYGNHRKYESQKPDLVWSVIESFVSLANDYGSPSQLISIAAADSSVVFDDLYRRLRPLRRFGRTGRFDFLVLLLDVGVIAVEPKSCYLRGATGPLKGARRLWGPNKVVDLDEMAADLAKQLGVSPIIIEDALCNWQK